MRVKRYAFIFLMVLIFWRANINASASQMSGEAEELTDQVKIECANSAVLTDGNEVTYTKITDGNSVVISSDVGIASLYVIFDRIYGEWTLSDGTVNVVCGKNDFLHEYIDVSALFDDLPKTLTLTFAGHDCSLAELHIFGEGEVPAWVQQWEPPCQEADLMLTSTHIDDEQLFFAGVLPYYAGECGLAVQVVYFTDPFTYHDRPHEQLNGLWTVGVRNYPVWGEFKDTFSKSAEDAYAHQRKVGFEREDMVRFQVQMIRRFRPHVIVGHDIDGEYGHGQHIINCETLMEALDLAADASYDPDSVLEYGAWDTPKAYIHLWEENPIVMDWDEPLEAFGGKTAFQVSQEGFLCHKSQLWTWFKGWIFGKNGEITKASEIKTYSPCLYGLYRTTVGLDDVGGDMFENILQSYAEIKAEEIRRQEEALAEEMAAKEKAEQEENPDGSEQEVIQDENQEENHSEDSSAQMTHSDSVDTDSANETGLNIYIGIALIAVSVIAVSVLYVLLKRHERNR